MLDALGRLPKALCHYDAWPANLFALTAPDATPRTGIIDWEGAGLGAAGIDLSQFVLGSLSGLYAREFDGHDFWSSCTEAYLDGPISLTKAAPPGGPERVRTLVRLGAAASGAARWGWLYLVGLVRGLNDDAECARWEAQFQLPIAHIAQLRAAAALLALDMADEARALLPLLQTRGRT